MDVLTPGLPPIGGDFNLIDHNGRCVERATYKDRFVLLFFGFTNCRVVCPRALTRISAALDLLEEFAAQITPLYVSVDPERDTPEVMKSFLTERFPRFTGLTGERQYVDAMKKTFRVFAQKVEASGGYVVPHTALTYMLSPSGEYLAHFPDSIDATELADRIRHVMKLCGT